jgi:4-amino-4-deoxy-L-arabinose transferase-like glycosyltransferase
MQAGKRNLILGLSLAAFALIWGLPFLVAPLSTDESYYALGGRVVFNGGQLYSDYWDVKPPLVYLVHVPLAPLTQSYEGLRVFHLAVSVLAVASVYLLARRFFSERAAVIAAALYGFSFVAQADYAALGETESFMVAPMALCFALYPTADGQRNESRLALGAGALLGVAVAFKFPAIILLLGLPAAELMLRQDTEWSPNAAARRLVPAFAGFAAVQMIWVVYLLASGSFADFIDILLNYTLPYSDYRWTSDETFARALARETAGWLSSASYLTFPAWGAIFLAVVGDLRRPVMFLAFLAALCIVTVWWQGKWYHYHWLIVLPFLAPLAGYACDAAIRAASSIARGEAYAVMAALALAFIVLSIPADLRTYDAYKRLRDRALGNASAMEIDLRYSPEFGLTRELVQHMKDHGAADDSFFVYGVWTGPYMMLERELPSRFVTNQGLRATWAPQSWKREFMDDLRAETPRFFVVAAGDNMPWLTGTNESTSEQFCNSFPELREFIHGNYGAVFGNGLFTLYDRKAALDTIQPLCSDEPI